MSERFDIVVIGAGPAGCIAALEAAGKGAGSVLLLEKEALPREKVCAGGLGPQSRRLLEKFRLWSQVERAGYPIRGVRLLTPSGRDFTISGKRGAAVVSRSRLDWILAEAAVRLGAILRPRSQVKELIVESGRVSGVKVGAQEIRSRYVVVANGACSHFHSRSSPRQRWLACLARFEGIPFTPHVVELHFEREFFPRFGWLFPESEERVNIGICLDMEQLRGRRIGELFGEFFQRRFADRSGRALRIGDLQCHPILPSGRVKLTNLPGTLTAGDAARLVNVFTGEGISYAMRSGRLAARAICAGLERGWDDARIAGYYLRLLRRTLEPSLRIGRLVCHGGRSVLHLASRAARRPIVRKFIYRALI